MEISDETTPVTERENVFEREVRAVFQETLGLIHIALVTHYGLMDGEASELEKDLYLWFVRFCRRPGRKSAKESRSFLLVACCQFAREYQKYLIGTSESVPPTNELAIFSTGSRVLIFARDFGRSPDGSDRPGPPQSRCLILGPRSLFSASRNGGDLCLRSDRFGVQLFCRERRLRKHSDPR